MYRFLENINASEDVKKLNIPELKTLASEIREFLISTVSQNSGHLSSNLGSVELTLALHKVFDFSKDKIVWDVGHQSYTHKIITGRRQSFETLRQKDGISGFPKTSENEADAFNTGHSSTSVSAALGFAKAFELKGENSFAVAVIGDGALTGGMAYEALNHAGSGNTPLIVVLNDNGMSISPNVGGVSKYLEKITTSVRYVTLKVKVKKFLKNLPVIGKPFEIFIRKSHRFLKKVLMQKKLFENMGLEYLGPIDGHDIRELITFLEYAKSLKKPVIVHASTQKGRGYSHSEKDPALFHGVGRFDPDTGQLARGDKPSYSKVFGQELTKLAKSDERIVAITAAMPDGTGLSDFAKELPSRFFDVGIAEQHAVTFSAGLAKGGMIPVFAVYSTFLQRGYDQLLHDVGLQNLHCVFALDHCGAVGNDGETHQGIYDLSYLSHIPNMTIMSPSCAEELKEMLKMAIYECKGPVAIRYPKGTANDGITELTSVEFGKGISICDGKDALIVAIGDAVNDALEAAELLKEKKISAGVVSARFLKPFDERLILDSAKGVRLVATVEDNVTYGGLSDRVRKIYGGEILEFSYGDLPLTQGTTEEQKRASGLDGHSIAEKIAKVLGD